MALAETSTTTITKSTTNSGVNVPTDTNQMQNCETAGGTSPIGGTAAGTGSCTATSSDTITQSGGVKK
jgi:uncharacterized OsmC-like protein